MMMKALTLLLLIVLFQSSCKQQSDNHDGEPIQLIGQIDNLPSKILLSSKGDRFRGTFEYLELRKSPINLEGSLHGRNLRLEEFDDHYDLSGIFIGTYLDDHYIGQWEDPQTGKKVPFSYQVKSTSLKNPAASTTHTVDI